MIAIGSPTTPRLSSPTPPVARRRHRRLHQSAPAVHHHYLRRGKSDPIANRELLGAMLNPSKSAVTVPTPRQQTLGMLKSP